MSRGAWEGQQRSRAKKGTVGWDGYRGKIQEQGCREGLAAGGNEALLSLPLKASVGG